MIATAKDLRFHLKEILDTVFRGQVVITYRAKPYAKIVPIEPSLKTVPGKNKLVGLWKDNKAVDDVKKYIRAQRRGRY